MSMAKNMYKTKYLLLLNDRKLKVLHQNFNELNWDIDFVLLWGLFIHSINIYCPSTILGIDW